MQFPPFDRRRFLALGGMAAVAAACSSSDEVGSVDTAGASTIATADEATTVGAPTTRGGVAAEPPATVAADAIGSDGSGLAAFGVGDFESLGACALLAESAAGPFPTLEPLDRRDVTEGYPGQPLRLGLRVIDETCAPVPGSVVEIWHADATGDYSSYDDGGDGKDEGEGTTFLRGFQTAADDGIVEFQSIYPGWYPGRTVHIHVRVHVAGELALTGQLYFDDEYTAEVLATGPYTEFGRPDTPNGRDPLAGPSIASGGLLTLVPGPTRAGAGTVALANLGIRA